MHEYVMPVARRSAAVADGRRAPRAAERTAQSRPTEARHGRRAPAHPPIPIIAANPAPTAHAATSPAAPPVRISGDVFACPAGRRTGLPNTGDGRAGVARCTTGDGSERRLARRARDATPRRPGRRRANAPLADGVRPNGPRLRAIGAITIARAAWKINSYDRMSRRKAAPAGARHGDGTQRAARSRISTRGAPTRRARRRRRAPHRPAGRRS